MEETGMKISKTKTECTALAVKEETYTQPQLTSTLDKFKYLGLNAYKSYEMWTEVNHKSSVWMVKLDKHKWRAI